jgi:hypothetical protein
MHWWAVLQFGILVFGILDFDPNEPTVHGTEVPLPHHPAITVAPNGLHDLKVIPCILHVL